MAEELLLTKDMQLRPRIRFLGGEFRQQMYQQSSGNNFSVRLNFAQAPVQNTAVDVSRPDCTTCKTKMRFTVVFALPVLLVFAQQLPPAAIWSGTNNYCGTSQSQAGPKFDEPLNWPAQASQPPANVCPGGKCSSQCGEVAPVALSDRIIGLWRSSSYSSFVVYAVSYDNGQILWQTEFNYTTQSSAGVPSSIAVSENGIIAVLYTKDFHQGSPLPNRNVTFALVNSGNGEVIHTETFGKQTGFTVPIAGPIVDPARGNVFYFASGGFYERYDNGSRVVLWDGTYGFSRPDFALQPGPDNIVVAIGAVGSGYGGTLETTTTDKGAALWHMFDNPQYSYSTSSFTNPTFTTMYYNVATSASGSFKGSMVSRDMKTGKTRWAWSSPYMKSVTMLNAGVRFVNATMTGSGNGTGTDTTDADTTDVQEQFAPLVVWKTNSGNYTLTMVDDTTGDSVWQFQTQWENCHWPLSVLTTGKDPNSLIDTKIVFTCQGSSEGNPVVSHVLDPTTGRELSAQSAKLVPYTTNVICYKWSAGRNTVFRYGANGEIVYARVN
jgi:hypothetical protein